MIQNQTNFVYNKIFPTSNGDNTTIMTTPWNAPDHHPNSTATYKCMIGNRERFYDNLCQNHNMFSIMPTAH